jgi:acetylglutamate kinase
MSNLSEQIVVLKYGGHALVDEKSRNEILKNIVDLKASGYLPVIVHGGGPYIKKRLSELGVESKFIGGHRYTTKEMMSAVETALKGDVNSMLVGELNRLGEQALGLTGKDGRWVKAKRRFHDGESLGQVGDVESIDPTLIHQLLKMSFLPVIATVSSDEAGDDYNVNADSFAGELAGALKAAYYINLTDVDGLYENIKDPSSLIKKVNNENYQNLAGNVIQGGMIPKVESCQIALKKGAASALITSGLQGHELASKLDGSCERLTRIEL